MPGRFRLSLALPALFSALAACSYAQAPPDAQARYREIVGKVSLTRIKNSYRAIASSPTRLSGSAGELAALRYAEARLKAIGALDIRREPFTVTVPDPSARGRISGAGWQATMLPMWPNMVRTSTCRVRGPIVYGADGTLTKLKGIPVQGAIVLIEIGGQWRNAAKLGASAIVFVGDQMTRYEAEQAFAAVPLRIPRFWLPLKDSPRVVLAALRREEVVVEARQDWVRLPTYNLRARLPGSDPALSGQPVALSAYADSISVVPGAAPGAEAAGGLSALLEVAEIYASRPRRRPLELLVTAAHFLGLQGSREFVDRRLETDRQGLFLAITLDLDSASSGMAALGRGWYYLYRDESQQPLQRVARAMRAQADILAPVLETTGARLLIDGVNQSDNRSWRNNIAGRFALDCEPMVQAGYPALTFSSTDSVRSKTDTPFDTIERVDFGNVLRQVQTIAAMLDRALNDTDSATEQSEFKMPSETRRPQRMSLIGGFATVQGRVALFDPGKSFVPDAAITDSIAVLSSAQQSMMGVRGNLIQLTDGPGARFRFTGVAPVSSNPVNERNSTMLSAFKMDASSGDIVYAPSLGVFGSEMYPFVFELKQAFKETPIVVFPARAIELYDMVDPQELRSFYDASVLDASTDAAPREYGFQWTLYDPRSRVAPETALVLFGSPGARLKLLLSSEFGELRGLLTNASPSKPTGYGYPAPGARQGPELARDSAVASGTLQFAALQIARDYQLINESRIREFDKYRIISAGVKELQAQAGEELARAEAALAAKDWPALDKSAKAAWSLALRVHPVLQATANDVVKGVIFYLFLLIPFSYFLERLLIASKRLTAQLAWSVAFFVAAFLVLRLIHPAFEIVTNPAMIFVGFVMGALSLIVIGFVTGKFETSLKTLKAAETGIREVDIGRTSVALAAFSLGIGNMRRRRARTLLTTLTLVVMTFIVLSFTSIVPELRLSEAPSGRPAAYAGIMMRMPGLEPLQEAGYGLLASAFQGSGVVGRRVWYYGAEMTDTSLLTLRRADASADFRAVAGFDPQETNITGPQRAILPGGRWLAPGDDRVILLPSPLAQALKIGQSEVGKATVRLAGEPYTVIGIYDVAQMRERQDLDGDGIMPADFTLSRQLQREQSTGNAAFRKFIRLDPATVVIIPSSAALRLGGELRSVGASLDRPDQARPLLESLMPRLRLNLYAGVPAGPDAVEVVQFSVSQASRSTGLGLVLVQMIIASVFVLNTMVASVYERTREISIFSAIGLAPNHIATLFFAESLVYGVLGSVIGYLAAQTLSKIIVATGALPGLYLNFSSMSAVLAAALVMAIVLLSTIYPARLAARIAAPALNEEAFKTEPDGDLWRIELPFNVSSAEAAPLIQFFADWFDAYERHAIGELVTTGASLSSSESPEGVVHSVRTEAWLAPFDLSVSQGIALSARQTHIPGIFSLDLELVRLGGEPGNWITVNRRFLAAIRRQFLTWRTLDAEARGRFARRAEATLAVGSPG